ncbi:hypothetical protein [Thermococcus waiotapuensis]|uniref:Uncharacterized protein n=1 Tax=Thermococcus waiotapuensis TaxID=90909 RepID=A0AAE4NVI3_9EURY|nr:hypothetical protein [Thermococcus waiotapuensis]MDV3104669.1 hypothetical protein [Thermococcus waiotapuensis]
MNWGKFALSFFLVALLLSLELIAAPQAMAIGVNNSSVTFRRAVVAWYDEKGKLDMNVTWVNATLNLTGLANFLCACRNASSCGALNESNHYNVSIVTLYNMTKKHEQLLFIRVTAYNATFNYTMYNLVYRAEKSRYNFTLVTRIFTDPETGGYRVFVTGMNIAPNDEDRVVPVGDVIITADDLTLSEYYWTLGRVLMGLGRHDVTKWVWDKSAQELRDLSRLVKLKLPEYEQEKAVGISGIMDSDYLLYAPSLGLFTVKIYCGNPVVSIYYVYIYAYASLVAIVAECGTGIGCIAGLLAATTSTRALCEYWKVCLAIGGIYTLSCTYA